MITAESLDCVRKHIFNGGKCIVLFTNGTREDLLYPYGKCFFYCRDGGGYKEKMLPFPHKSIQHIELLPIVKEEP